MTTRLALDDLVVGRSWSSPSRTVTEADVGAFAGLTGDHFPLHTSETYAARTPFGTRIAHGLLGMSVAHGLMWARTGELDDSIVALLGVDGWRFRAPLHFGDTIRVEYVVAERVPSRTSHDRGVVSFDVTVVNQHEAVVQQGRMSVLVHG